MKSMARNLNRLAREVKAALHYIATIRNRFCHEKPWFHNEQEKLEFINHVRYLTESFQLEFWRGDPLKTRYAFMTPSSTVAAPVPLMPPPPPPLLQGGYEVPATMNPEIKHRIEKAQVFAASQRVAVSESQRMPDEDEEEAVKEKDDEWSCGKCNYLNRVESLLCVMCGQGVPPDRWKCKICANVNFSYEDSCYICDSNKIPDADVASKNNNNVLLLLTGSSSEATTHDDADHHSIQTQQPPTTGSNGSRKRQATPPEPQMMMMMSSRRPSKLRREEPAELAGWILERTTDNIRVYRNVASNAMFEVEWPLPTGWRLTLSTSRPNERLCFICNGRKQAQYPLKDTPDGWVLVKETNNRRTYEKIADDVDGEAIQWETPWPVPEGWVVAVSKSKPNQLCYLKLADGTKIFRFPRNPGA